MGARLARIAQRITAVARVLVRASTGTARVVTERLPLVYHVTVVILSAARAAGMVHQSSGSGLLSRRSARRLKERHALRRDIMIIGSTGFRTFVDPRGDLHTAIEHCRTAKIMLLDPES